VQPLSAAAVIQAETLELLEWPRLCQHLSTFAATKLGAVAARHLAIPETLDRSLALLAQTKEVYQLESQLTAVLSFEGIQDIGASLERAELQGILSGAELLHIATTLAGMRRLRRQIDGQSDVPVLMELVTDLRTYPDIEQEINRCIDDLGKVTDRASPKLSSIRSQLKSLRDRIYQTLQGILQRKFAAVQENQIAQRGDRFVIPVKAPQKSAIPGIVHDTSTTGATLYVEPHAIVPLGNQLRQLQRQEEAEEEAILRDLTEKIAEVKEDLERLLAIATALDLATARARYSLWLEANPPRFIDRGGGESITLRQLRHPLLVWQQQHEQGPTVVPVDLMVAPPIKVVAITGPNTGGKTVTLKTLGLAALMAKVGLFVPAREPVELPWFDKILADIGDEQSLEQSLSTFSGHIRRITRILQALGNAELVLLDEVGAGTDPSEGSALAIALLQYLASNAQLTVATTHFGELKALKYEDDRFENASVEFDNQSLQPTYRLLWGIPGRSNALTIAHRLGLNHEIVELARGYIGDNEQDVNQVIADLEAQLRRQERKTKQASKLVTQAERLHEEVSLKASALQAQEQKLRQQQELAVQEAIAEAKKEIARVIRKLQQGPVLAQRAQRATEEINKIAEIHLPSKTAPPKPKPAYKPQVGDKVRIPSLGQTGDVLNVSEADAEVTVRFGLMKMTIAFTEIESLDGQKVEQPKPKPAATIEPPKPGPVVQTESNTVDLRGSRVADAEAVLEDAIAKGYASGTGALWIIHGKGTGKLREGVHDFLQQHPQIDRFELAQPHSGGTGVTIAYFK